MATDIRLLAHEGELLESFGSEQVGSSAMPYKRNPIHSERICGIARFVMSLSQNPAYTTATQWLERTLDDSSNRRLSIPEAFLGADAVLNLLNHLLTHLSADRELALQRLQEQAPLLAMENLLMLAVKKGASRQEAHEKLRQIAIAAKKHPHQILEKIEKDLSLNPEEISRTLDLTRLIGAAPEQVHDFLKQEVHPFLSNQKGPQASFPPIEN